MLRARRGLEKTGDLLRRAIKTWIREEREERRRRQAADRNFDEIMKKLAAVHLENEQGLKDLKNSTQALIDSIRRIRTARSESTCDPEIG